MLLQNGSLAVPDGRAIIPAVNKLLSLPFALKLATKDHHPPDHVSFASNHPSAKPFETVIAIVNPNNPTERYESLLWPDHCVIGTPGNELIPDLDLDRVDKVILKGTDPRVEMYSAFQSPLKNPPLPSAVSELADDLNGAGITDVVVVGLAGDVCVKCTAIDSCDLGWPTFVVEEGVRSVGGDVGWGETRVELEKNGVRIVSLDWVKKVCSSYWVRSELVLTIIYSSFWIRNATFRNKSPICTRYQSISAYHACYTYSQVQNLYVIRSSNARTPDARCLWYTLSRIVASCQVRGHDMLHSSPASLTVITRSQAKRSGRAFVTKA